MCVLVNPQKEFLSKAFILYFQINIKSFCMCASNQIYEYFVIKIPLSLFFVQTKVFSFLYIVYVCETEKVAAPQFPLVSQPKKGCLDCTSAVSQSIRHLTIERETVGTARDQFDSSRLSAEAAVEHSSILLENDKDSDVVCERCLIIENLTDLRRCAGCKSFSYCSKDCQI